MWALFFLFVVAVILFFPLRFVFGFTLNLTEKYADLKIKLYNAITVADKRFCREGLGIIDVKTNKPLKIKADKKTDIKKAFKIKRVCVMFVFDFADSCYFLTAWNDVISCFQNKYRQRLSVYFENVPKHKIIAAEGIIYTSVANIIFRLILSFGEYLWKQLKTKLKKSSTG